ncbi:MAG: class I SAM-dependent methyltransferase [Kiritimatiellia bacterium]
MAEIDFVSALHQSTTRNYLERVVRGDKAECAEVAKRFDAEYWDGERKYGYGGYYYDGRWAPVAAQLADYYGLTPESAILDVGCGKGFLLYEFNKLMPGVTIRGLDISRYAVEHAKEEVRPFLDIGHARRLPYPDKSFDLVLSLGTLHNLYLFDLVAALQEIERVKRKASYIVVESYRNEREKANLLNWQLTCEAFFTPAEWVWLFQQFGYTGDYSFLFFE